MTTTNLHADGKPTFGHGDGCSRWNQVSPCNCGIGDVDRFPKAEVKAYEDSSNLLVWALTIDGEPATYLATPDGTDRLVYKGEIIDALLDAETGQRRLLHSVVSDAIAEFNGQ